MRGKLDRGLILGTGLLAAWLAGCAGCGDGGANPTGGVVTTGNSAATSSGDLRVEVDGSSTVYVLSQAVTEEFGAEDDKVNVTVKSSGTGGGFKRFVDGKLDITGASRPIKSEEMELAEKNGVEYIELPVCFDALTVAVPITNDWVDSITVAELKSIWESAAEGKIMKWNQVPGHESDWPDQKLALAGAGADSGTFEYFTEAICKEKGNHRKDYAGNENDNVIVTSIESNKYAMGYIPFAYYEPHKAKLKALKIDWKADDEQEAVAPSIDNVIKGIYNPLARPLFIYINRKSADKAGVQQYVDFYLKNAAALAKDVQYIPLPADAYSTVTKRWSDRKTGTVFGGKAAVGLKLEDIVKAEG